MCNCGHEERDEAARLKRVFIASVAGAAVLAGIPAMMPTMHGHHALLAVVIVAQLGFVANALRALVRRKALLASLGVTA